MATEFDIEDVIKNASTSEKTSLLAGKDFWHTRDLPRFNVPSIRVSDGPNGVRGTKFFNGVPAACLPCGTGLASTWDKELLHRAGVLIGQECLAKGAHCWLGPTTNIQRSPLGGRGFESFSEDPYLSGKLAASYINGTQSTGVLATIKHFVANDQEHQRNSANVIVSQRALREIYLLPFQIAIAESAPGAIMTAYNKVNGTHVSENSTIINDILRGEWGADIMVMSDWFGTYSVAESLIAGLDLEMPGPPRWRTITADLSVSSCKVRSKVIDERARSMLKFIKRASKAPVSEVEGTRDFPEDRELNRKLATDSTVLLKNDHGVLPLSKSIEKIALIGPSMKNVAFCGGGSAALEPYYVVTPFQGIVEALPKNTVVEYEVGCYNHALLPTLGPHIKRLDGKQGAVMRFYTEPHSVKDREVIDEINVRDTMFQLMDYRNPKLAILYWATLEATFTAPTTGTYDFGITVYGSANLYIDGALVVENTEIQRPGTTFFGKGTAEERGGISMVEGQTYSLRLEFASSPTSKVIQPGVVAFPGGAGRVGAALRINEEESIARAVKLASDHKHTIVCTGLSGDWEAEGFDRPTMDLPGASSRLITAVLEANPDAVIVTQSGTPITMHPWSSKASTQIHTWYGGNEVGNGLADVIFGNVNPSARLPLSFPIRCEDNPAFLNSRCEGGRINYGEDIYVGYRYYDKIKRDVLFAFGHGLSYTTFSFSDLKISIENNEFPTVAVTVTNTGSHAGAEVVQVYIGPPSPTTGSPRTVNCPEKELRGFSKVFLAPNESREIQIQLDRFAGAYWDEIGEEWVVEKGEYRVLVGRSSAESGILLEGTWSVEETCRWTGL